MRVDLLLLAQLEGELKRLESHVALQVRLFDGVEIDGLGQPSVLDVELIVFRLELDVILQLILYHVAWLPSPITCLGRARAG